MAYMYNGRICEPNTFRTKKDVVDWLLEHYPVDKDGKKISRNAWNKLGNMKVLMRVAYRKIREMHRR